uniref:BLOC-1-related complex subunit 7 n=1 Tax=Meloidogyne hapla TaxID=6305 RepID=A0A1I8BYN5_MELHA
MANKKATNIITLEGKTRLPNRVQDIIIEMGTVIGNIQQTSGLSDALQTSIRNFVAVDGIAQNSAQNLDKLAKQVELMETQTFEVEQSLGSVRRLIKQAECLEKSNYCTENDKNCNSN